MSDLTNPQGSGAMTLEQGVASMKAKLAKSGATVDDTAIVHAEDPNEEELAEGQVGELETETTEPAQETDTNDSADESDATQTGFANDNAKTLMPDGSSITIAELRKGHLLHADYTRKTQAVASKERELMTREQALTQQLGGLIQQVASLKETEPTPDQMYQLRQTDREKYEEVKAYWDYRRPILAEAQRQIQQNNARALSADKAQAFETLNSGTFDPAWKDAKVLDQALRAVSDYWIERGLPRDVLEGISNPTVIEVVEESRRYRELQKAKPKAALALKGKPAPFKPGAKSTASPQSETIRLLDEAYRQNPTPANAAARFKAKWGTG